MVYECQTFEVSEGNFEKSLHNLQSNLIVVFKPLFKRFPIGLLHELEKSVVCSFAFLNDVENAGEGFCV